MVPKIVNISVAIGKALKECDPHGELDARVRAAADTEAGLEDPPGTGGAAEEDEDEYEDASSLAAFSADSALALASSSCFHVLWTACWLFLESFCHSLSGMLGGRKDPRKGLLKTRLPYESYLYHRPIESCL